MKLEGVKNEIETSGNMEQTSFRIKTSANSFRILSSGLYKNKVRAIVRELGTNAWDAHVAAGNTTKPFYVHLPNRFEPFFMIRDYGTGLSDNDIKSIYTTYFESNKSDSNDFTGCLGLGSKSPFSYTDSFAVSSYQNGRKTTWTAFVGEEGVPMIAFVSEEVTDEPDGLCVQFPVAGSDIDTFLYEAKSVYNNFVVRPKIVGQTVNWTELPQPLMQGAYWAAYDRNTTSKSMLVMGNVTYPIEWGLAGVCSRLFNRYNIRINANIGDVDITASRETLKYTKRTKDFIARIGKQIGDEMSKQIHVELDKEDCLYNARHFVRQHYLFFPHGSQFVWKGTSYASDATTNIGRDFIRLKCIFKDKILKKIYSVNSVYGQAIQYNIPLSRIMFVVADIRRGTEARVRYHVKNNQDIREVYIFTKPFKDEAERKAFVDNLGIRDSDIIMASTLAKAKYPKKNTTTQPNVDKIFKYDNKSGSMKSRWILEPTAAGGYYVELNGFKPTGYKTNEFDNIIGVLQCLDATLVCKIYGVHKSMLPKIQGNSAWIPLTKAVEHAKIQEAQCLEMATHYDYWSKLNCLDCIKKTNNKVIMDMVAEYKKFIGNFETISKLRYIVGEEEREKFKNNKVEDFLTKIEKQYPLVAFWCRNGQYPSDTHLVQHYVELVEAQYERQLLEDK
jgi:hypothetical protein